MQSLYGAKVQAHAAHQDYLEIKLEKESEVRRLDLLAIFPISPNSPSPLIRTPHPYFTERRSLHLHLASRVRSRIPPPPLRVLPNLTPAHPRRVSLTDGPQYEQLIDTKYLDNSDANGTAWRLESYRAAGSLSSTSTVAQQLRCYFVSKCSFANPPAPKPTGDQHDDVEAAPVDIKTVADKVFLEKATENTLEIYQNVMDEALKRCAPLFSFILRPIFS